MAITSAICSSFKQELLQGKHNFASSGGHTFKLALFTSSASLGAGTTDYSTSNEITNTSGTAYTAGGATLTRSGALLKCTLNLYVVFGVGATNILPDVVSVLPVAPPNIA